MMNASEKPDNDDALAMPCRRCGRCVTPRPEYAVAWCPRCRVWTLAKRLQSAKEEASCLS